jgi:hypothetical protein
MLEAYQKEVEKNEPTKNPKPEEPTLKDILSKKEDSDLFGELLKSEQEVGLTGRLAKGELKDEDIQSLDKYRKEFLGTMERVKTVKESINEDIINLYTKNNPELQKVVSLIGPSAYKDIVKEKIAKLAITDPGAFNSLSEAVERKNEFKDGYFKELDEKVSNLCKEKGISPEKYSKALAITDDGERKKALRGSVREGYNWMQKAGDWISMGSWSKNRIKLMESQKPEIDSALEQMRTHQSSVGEFLAGMTEYDDIRSVLSKELIGDKEEKVPLQGFKESKGGMPTKESLQKSWDEYKQNMQKPWDELTPLRQEKEREAFVEAQKETLIEQNKKKSGFWSSIFEIFSVSFFNSNKAELN